MWLPMEYIKLTISIRQQRWLVSYLLIIVITSITIKATAIIVIAINPIKSKITSYINAFTIIRTTS